jgi:ABC-type thiamin/hydroxymethylpyrimidine transport system permease subunit
MKGLRKLIIGVSFLITSTVIVLLAVHITPADQLAAVIASTAGVITAKSMGLGVIVYGNVKEHQSNGG